MSPEDRDGTSSRRLVHLTYRPDIDGLRAIAVLSVVTYHAFPGVLKAGFVGVDLFFVISGFLISSIIFTSLARDSFSFFEFYSRRIRRIFPSLLTVLIASYAFGWFSLFPDEYRQLGKHIAAGAGFVSNFAFWNESGYFDSAVETKPLLHLWSLAIEEQFYILWPLLLWAAWKKNLHFLAISLMLFLASFGANLLTYRIDGVAVFYSPQTRCWELLAGALPAYIHHHRVQKLDAINVTLDSWLGKIIDRRRPELQRATARDIQSLFGVLLLVLSLVLITNEQRYPGIWAILPVLGAVCVIAAGSNSWPNRTFFSNRILVWFGIISFPLYLWHWPLLSFARVIEGEAPARTLRLATVLASIILAWLTYKLIEHPFRSGKSNRTSVYLLAATMMLVGCAGYTAYQRDGLPFRLSAHQLRQTHPLPTKMHIDDYEKSELFQSIWKNAEPIKSRDILLSTVRETNNETMAIIGDSHAGRLYLGLEDHADLSLLNIGRGTCPPFLDVDVLAKSGRSLSCQPLTNNYLKLLKDNRNVKVVILNAFYIQYNRDVALVENGIPVQTSDAIARTVRYLAESGKIVVVALDVPEIPTACYRNNSKRHFPIWEESLGNRCFVHQLDHNALGENIRSTLSHVESTSGKVFVIDPADVLCRNEVCGEIDEANYLYHTDGNHLNEFGTEIVGESLAGKLHDVLSSASNK